MVGILEVTNCAKFILPTLGQPNACNSITFPNLNCIYIAATVASAPPRLDPVTTIFAVG